MTLSRVIVVGLSGLFFLSATQALAAYGAFAYDQGTGRYGFSWNRASQEAANDAAIRGCRSSDCKVVFRIGPRQCGAVALSGNNKGWGGAKRSSRETAELAAVQNCEKRAGGQCKVKGSDCNH